jgi:hypothetical protein
MTTSFYDVLNVRPDADAPVLRRAWQEALAGLMRRVRAARDHGQDTARLEDERYGLEEAWAVLSDPNRRAHYDCFLAMEGRPLPTEAEELWGLVSASMLDSSARATLGLVRVLTSLPAGPETPRPAPPPPALPGSAPPKASRLSVVPPPQSATIDHPGEDLPSSPMMADRQTAPWHAGALPAAAKPDAPPDDSLPSLVMRYGYSGELLKQVREKKGITLEQVASQSRISLRYLEAIESDDHARLPATTFVKGYLKEFARILDLNVEAVVNGYVSRMSQTRTRG